MKPEQVVQRLFNSIQTQISRLSVVEQLSVLELLGDEIERELGRIEEEGSSQDERFRVPKDEDEEDEDV